MATSTSRTLQINFAEGIQFTKNYVENSIFQNNTLNGWARFNTTLTGGYPTGAISNGAASITTFAITSTNPISGTYSLQLASSAAWAAGEGFISDEFTIQREDLGKPLTFQFSYEVIANPTNANWSGQLGSQTLAVYIYDVTAGSWIQPSGFLGMNQTSGVGQVMGNFQSSVVSGQKYRLAIIALQASAGAITVNFDNFFLGKETSTVGTPVTDYIDYTPTTSWTTGYTISGKFKRIGDSIECIVKLVCTGAPVAASETTFSIPPGYAIDTTKLMSPTVAGTAPTFGDAIGYDVSTTNLYLFRCQYWSATTVKLFYQSSSTGQETAVSTSLPPTWATNDTIIARFQVPIVGLSSSVEMSNATDTRVVSARYSLSSGSPVAGSQINFANIGYDTHGAVTTGASWKYTAPVSGYYRVSLVLCTGASNNIFALFKNGTLDSNMSYTIGASATNNVSSSSTVLSLKAGDYFDVRPSTSNGSYAAGGGTGSSISTSNYITVERLSGPSVIAATETVACQFTDTSGFGVTSGDTLIAWGTKVFDTHNAMSSGTYTVPVTGKYHVSAVWQTTSVTVPSGTGVSVSVVLSGVEKQRCTLIGSGATATHQTQGNIILNCVAGDTIQIKKACGIATTGITTAGRNNVSIVRVGN